MPDSKLVNLSDAATRERLSPAARSAFVKISSDWGVSADTSARLVDVSPQDWQNFGQDKTPLSEENLTRISALLGIYTGLHVAFPGDLAHRWPSLANDGPLFDSKTPIETMLASGIPAMLNIRRQIDADNGGSLTDFLPYNAETTLASLRL